MPMRSDPSQYSISNVNHTQHPNAIPYLSSADPGLHSHAPNTTYQLRGPSIGPLPSNRGSFDQGQLAQISSSRQSSISGHTESPIATWSSDMAMMPGENQSFLPESFQTATSEFNNFSESASYIPGMSLPARQLPQPGSIRGLAVRGSASGGYSLARQNEQFGYNGDNYDLEPVLSETSGGSMTSNSHGPASTSSSSPMESREKSHYIYTPVSQPLSDIRSQQLGDYNMANTGTSTDHSPSLVRTSNPQDNHAHLPIQNPSYQCYNHQLASQSHASEPLRPAQAPSRHMQAQYRYQPRQLRPLTNNRN